MADDTAPRLRTLKSLGQHFLSDKGIARRIVQAADVAEGDNVLEIGPGKGILTEQLLAAGAHVTAIELDRGLYEGLCDHYRDHPRVALHHADALKVDPAMAGAGYKVVANLPYQVTTPLLFHFLEAAPTPACIVVMIQKEVADRILAGPGDKIYGVLSLGVQARASGAMCFKVPPGAFRPPPKVTSAVIRVNPYAPEQAPVPPQRVAAFMQVVRAALGQRRKTLGNALKGLKLPPEGVQQALEACGIDPQTRGETLGLEEFAGLAERLFRN